jgi:cytochrome c biogenesis protein CcmG, thiol:disulfide interchange protein DsbE
VRRSSAARCLAWLALALAIPVFPIAAQTPAPRAASPGAAAKAGAPGHLAPDFTRTDLSGSTLSLSRYRGKIVLLNFWATWCAPCLAEIPKFSLWQQTHGAEGLQVLGVSMDDDSGPVKRTLRKYGIAYPVVMGDAPLGELYGGVLGLPQSYLIDASGRIVARYEGEPDLNQMESRIKELLTRLRR